MDDEERQLDQINLEHEIKKIYDRKEHYYSMWLIYSIIDKVLLIINFGTLLICVLVKVDKLGLILSFFTLSVGVLIDSKEYVILLEKLLNVYTDTILPKIKDYKMAVIVNDQGVLMSNVLDQIRHIQQIEKDNIEKFMGYGFTLPNSLRTLACRKILVCGIAYMATFICIPVLYHYYWQ